jgi:response regulator RpfG family c-di-GMP phosphodiesterase
MRFYLPKAEGIMEDKREGKVTDEKTQKGTILLIDDEEVIRELCRDILEAYNYQAFLASHGDEGISLFNEHKDSIQLVILDMIMPGKSGKQVFRDRMSTFRRCSMPEPSVFFRNPFCTQN